MSSTTPEWWRRVNAVVAGAMNAPRSERATFIDRACGSDLALRREVASLLRAAGGRDRSLDTEPADPHSRSTKGATDDEGDDEAIRTTVQRALGERYEILRPLGRGGMGVVYLVRDRRHDRPLALKVLRPDVVGAAFGAERFLREIRIAAHLSHPHILALHDSGSVGGLLYYTMPYLPGESLRDRLRREGELPLEVAVAIARQVAAALDCAHRHGVVHRDVKPENILLHEGQAFVADFGVARAVDVAADDRLTATGVAIGTPVYMSPEQAAGDRDVDGRSDTYSLACVVYEMLAGAPPFSGPGAHAIITQKLTQDVPSLCALRDGVPLAVDAALRRALRRARADRFTSAEEFALALERAASAATDAPPGVRARFRHAFRAHRDARAVAGFAVATIGVLALAGMLASGMLGDRRQPAVHDMHALAVLPTESDSPDVGLATDLNARLAGELGRIGALRVTRGMSSSRYRGTTKSPEAIAEGLDVDALVESVVSRTRDSVSMHVRLLGARAGAQLWASEFAADSQQLERMLKEVVREVVDFLQVPLTDDERQRLAQVRLVDARASEAYQRGLRMTASLDPDRLRKAIAAFEESIRLDPQFPAPYVAIAETYQNVGVHDTLPAAEAFRLAEGYAKHALQLDPDNSEAHVVLAGILHMWDWDWAGAEREFMLAIGSNPGSARAHWQYGAYLRTMARCDSAVAELQRARRIDPLFTVNLADLSFAYGCAGRPDSAMSWARLALDLDPSSPPLYLALGNAFVGLGQIDSATRAFKRATELNPLLKPLLPAYAYAVAGRFTDADRVIAAMSDRARRRRAGSLALLYASRGDREATFRYLDLAVREHNVWLGEVANSPGLERFADDPRYKDFRRRLGLPPTPPSTSPRRGGAGRG